jgi:6-carboxyhexanoate--CoA ligase
MRGAIIMDSQTGERLEPDPERGVRVSRFDWDERTLVKIKRGLEAIGLTHFRTYEALALATKVAHAPCLVAELCWSDEPSYTAGYVASQALGYVRFPMLKQKGDPCGGRVFYVNTNKLDMDILIRYLQTETVLISEVGLCRRAVKPEAYLKSRR